MVTINPFEDDFGAEGITGSQFFSTFVNRSQTDRENAAIQMVKDGNFVQWPMVSIPLSSASNLKGSINVASDYLAVGTPDDFFYLPLSPIAAQKIADILNLSLPTSKIVRDTWNSALQVQPQPMRNVWIAQKVDPDKRMVTLQGFADHNAAVAKAIGTRNPAQLISGTKKDVVLSNRIRPDTASKRGSVAIYGWFDKLGQFVKAGSPIQGLNPSDHDNGYADYSHGIRFVDPFVTLSTGEKVALTDARIASLVSDEGSITISRYGVRNGDPTLPGIPAQEQGNITNVALVTPNDTGGVSPQKRGVGGLGLLAGLGAIGGAFWWRNRS